MMAGFLKSQLDFIFFAYGAAFFLLIPLCLFLRQRPNTGRLAWVWLGWFGGIHGTNEWLDLIALSSGANTPFDLARVGTLIVSFLFLAEFGRASIVSIRGHGPGRWFWRLWWGWPRWEAGRAWPGSMLLPAMGRDS
jgi:hypothetical protein